MGSQTAEKPSGLTFEKLMRVRDMLMSEPDPPRPKISAVMTIKQFNWLRESVRMDDRRRIKRRIRQLQRRKP